MEIVNRSIGSIMPYEKNPRKNDDAVKYVAESIKQFGFKVPIVIDQDGIIVAGHTRYKAAKKLKLQEVPCIVADDLTEEQVKAFRLADNKVAEKSEWDFDLLGDELDDILNIDMNDFGFDFEYETEQEEGTSEIAKDAVAMDSIEMEGRMQKAPYVFYSFSGGRDSTLALMATYNAFVQAGKSIEVLYVDNGCEFPDLIMHIRRVCKTLGAKLTVIHSGKSFITEYVEKGKFPDPVFMDCVENLINKPIDNYIKQVTGGETDYILVRGGKKTQKTSRSKTDRLQYVKQKPHMIIYNPAYDYSDKQDMDNIPEWKGYSMGFDRTACWCCPFQKESQWEALRECYPLLYDELKYMFTTTTYKVINGDGHPKYVKKYWEDKVGIKCKWSDATALPSD